mmetsp:Transcript_21027/g.47150  ORF Transcript_21027/g.47150 Transcript_21027/m.47150 type:complete len:245 (-) Transcript_21027:1685-2419(-)
MPETGFCFQFKCSAVSTVRSLFSISKYRYYLLVMQHPAGRLFRRKDDVLRTLCNSSKIGNRLPAAKHFRHLRGNWGFSRDNLGEIGLLPFLLIFFDSQNQTGAKLSAPPRQIAQHQRSAENQLMAARYGPPHKLVHLRGPRFAPGESSGDRAGVRERSSVREMRILKPLVGPLIVHLCKRIEQKRCHPNSKNHEECCAVDRLLMELERLGHRTWYQTYRDSHDTDPTKKSHRLRQKCATRRVVT